MVWASGGVVISEFFDKEFKFFFFLFWGGDILFFYKLTRNPNLTKTSFFWGGEGVMGG